MSVKSQAQLVMASELADSTAAKVDETLERAPAGAIHEQLVGDLSYAEGVRDALTWATGLNPATGRLARLLDLTDTEPTESECRHCGLTIRRRDLTPEQAAWRSGRTVIWVDMYGTAKTAGRERGHYHEPTA